MSLAVALGGNLGGERLVIARFESALAELSADWGPPRQSSWYRSAPQGPVQDQPDFVNGVALWDSVPAALAPEQALARLLDIERRHGREREVFQGPRPLDLDLLWFGEARRRSPELHLPHPRMADRAFVLQPLVELCGPEFFWPGAPAPVGELLARVADQRLTLCSLAPGRSGADSPGA